MDMVAKRGQPPRQPRTVPLMRLPTIIRRLSTIIRRLPTIIRRLPAITWQRQHKIQVATTLYYGGHQVTKLVATSLMTHMIII